MEISNVLERLKTRFEQDTRRSNLAKLKTLCQTDEQTLAAFFEKYVVLARKCNIPEDLQIDWMTDRLPSSLNTAITTLKIANIPLNTNTILDILRSDAVAKALDSETRVVSTVQKRKWSSNKKLKWCKHHKRCNHVTEECRYLNKNREYVFSVINPGTQNSKRFFQTVSFANNQQDSALIDTGADLSCISSHLAKKLGLIYTQKCNIRTANGKIEKGWVTQNMKLNILGCDITAKLLTLENLTHDVIIGLDLLTTLRQFYSWDTILKPIAHSRKNIVNNISEDYKEVMSKEIDACKPSKFPLFKIDTGNSKPIQILRYRLGKPLEEKAEQEISRLLKNGIIRRSNSSWCSPIVVVPKNNDEIRLCVDYRALNTITNKDAYPLPRIDEILDSLSGATIFSTLDATSGYYQIPITPEDIHKTAFQTSSGLYEFTRMPFGLANAPAAFQRAIDSIFSEEKGKFLQVYLDDIIIYSKTESEHQKHLELVLKKIKESGLKLKESKCKFSQKELTILGYRISKNQIKPTEDRIGNIKNFPVPNTIKELRSFLGLVSYCRTFVENLAAKAKPLSDLLKNNPSASKTVIFTNEENEAFNIIKGLINDTSKLAIPDYEKPFIVITDASTRGISGILAQKSKEGEEIPVSFFSKTLNDAQSRYSATQLELLAVIETLRHFKHYLIHKRFLLKTDHEALLALNHTKNRNSMLFRWSLLLSDFDFDIEHIKGENNPADILSRLNAISTTQCPNKSL
ncbi:MAG: pol polyprotein, partial [Aeromonas sp.]